MEFSEQDYEINAKTLRKSRKISIPKRCPTGATVFIIWSKVDEGSFNED